MSVPTPIIVASAQMPIASVGLYWNKQLRTDLMDEAVWEEVRRLLEPLSGSSKSIADRCSNKSTRLMNFPASKRGWDGCDKVLRLIDRYTEGLFGKAEFEPRVTRMRERLQHMEVNAQQVRDETSLERELTLILGRLDEFAARVKTGLHEADWLTRREIIRAHVKRVEIGQEQVRAVFRVNPPPHTPQPLQKKIPKVCIIVGGVHGPILSTISLSKLDHNIENTLIPMYTKGARQKSREYSALATWSRHP